VKQGSLDLRCLAFTAIIIGDISPKTQASGKSIQMQQWSLAMASNPPRYPQGWSSSPGLTKIPSIGLEPWLCVGGSAGPCHCAIALVIPKL